MRKVEDSCNLPVTGDRVALFDAVDTSELGSPVLGGALPPVETTFDFGYNPASSLTGARLMVPKLYTPKCRTKQNGGMYWGKCIEGIVVESFGAEISTPSPEANARDITYVVTELVYKYPKETKDYKVAFYGCCRMGSPNDGTGSYYDLINDPNGVYHLRADVQVTDDPRILQTGTAASPFFEAVPHVTAIKGRPLDFRVFAFDAANRPIKYRVGDPEDHGANMNTNTLSKPGKPFGNVMLARVDEDTGVVTFPASASTSYENYYHLVIVAEAYGPCMEWSSTGDGLDQEVKSSQVDQCYGAGKLPVTKKTSTVVDFLIRVVFAGFTGDWPQSRCDNSDSGLPSRSKVCNSLPLVVVPPSPQRFICNELSQFSVTATDGIGKDKSVSVPQGVFAIRFRQRAFLEQGRGTPRQYDGADRVIVQDSSLYYPRGQCSDELLLANQIYECIHDTECKRDGTTYGTCVKYGERQGYAQNQLDKTVVPQFPRDGSIRAISGTNKSLATAMGTFQWTPLCERLEANRLYSYQGNHRLDVFGVCFVAVDEGGRVESQGKLLSPPGWVECVVLIGVECKCIMHTSID